MTQHPPLKASPNLAELQAFVTDVVNQRQLSLETIYCMLMLSEEVGELAKAVRKSIGGKMDVAKPDANPAEEAADVLWLLLCVCSSLNIDLEQAFRDKNRKNQQRVWQ